MAYCVPSDVRELAAQLKATMEPTPATDTVLTNLIERASRIFDKECDVSNEYFEPATGDPTARAFYGDGTNYLRLDPYVDGTLSTTITVPNGYTAPTFVARDGYLIISSNGVLPPFRHFNNCWWPGWWSGVPITVTAKWGFSATPADVKHAIIEFVINLFRETDPAFLKLVNVDGGALRERMPPRVVSIANKYKLTAAAFV